MKTLLITLLLSISIYSQSSTMLLLMGDGGLTFTTDYEQLNIQSGEGFIVIRQDDSKNEDYDITRTFFTDRGIYLENGLNEGDNKSDYGFVYTIDVAKRMAERERLKYWVGRGQGFADHTPNHHAFTVPRLRDPLWDGVDTVYHYGYDTPEFRGAWRDSCYTPHPDTMLSYPFWTAIITGIQTIGYFNLSASAKAFIEAQGTTNYTKHYSWNPTTQVFYDTVYYIKRNLDIDGTLFVDSLYNGFTGFDSTTADNGIFFSALKPIKDFLIAGQQLLADSIGFTPKFWVHPGASLISRQASISHLGLFYGNYNNGERIYDVLTHSHTFLPSNYTNLAHLDTANRLVGESYTGYGMPEKARNYFLSTRVQNVDMSFYDTSQVSFSMSYVKKAIADGIARGHFVQPMMHGVFDYGLMGELLDWFDEKEIKVLSSEDAENALSQVTDSLKNALPSTHNDLDEDGIPDGWGWTSNVWTPVSVVDDTVFNINGTNNAYVYALRTLGITDIKQGLNEFSMQVKGDITTPDILGFIEQYVWVDSLDYYELKDTISFTIPTTADWATQYFSYRPDTNLVYINVRFRATASCFISDIKLKRYPYQDVTELPSAVAVWETDYGTTTSSTGDSLFSWTDKVGGVTVNTSGTLNINAGLFIEDAINGYPALLTDGVSDRYNGTLNDSVSNPTTMYFLVKPMGWTNNRRFFNGGGNGLNDILQSGITPNIIIRSTTSSTGIVPTLEEWVVLTGVVNGANSKIQYNEETPNTVSLTNKTFKGALADPSHTLVKGYFVLISLFEEAHSEAVQRNARALIYEKYGL